MFRYFVLLSALAFAAPGIAMADDNQPRSFTDLTATDPPANTFHGQPSMPPGLGGTFPPGCNVLAADKDDAHHGANGDDKNPDHGNPNCQPLSR